MINDLIKQAAQLDTVNQVRNFMESHFEVDTKKDNTFETCISNDIYWSSLCEERRKQIIQYVLSALEMYEYLKGESLCPIKKLKLYSLS